MNHAEQKVEKTPASEKTWAQYLEENGNNPAKAAQVQIAELKAQISEMQKERPVAEWVNEEQGFQYLTQMRLPDGTQLYAAPQGVDLIRSQIQQMTLALSEGEWADLLSPDPDVSALEVEIGKLVNRVHESVVNEDSARLDWVLNATKYRVQGTDEYGWRVLDWSNGLTFFIDRVPTAREAIDAARLKLNEKN